MNNPQSIQLPLFTHTFKNTSLSKLYQIIHEVHLGVCSNLLYWEHQHSLPEHLRILRDSNGEPPSEELFFETLAALKLKKAEYEALLVDIADIDQTLQKYLQC